MYLPISRKYRPQKFDEIIGQEHVTKTLKNAISMNKVAHAYLFSGSRGVGKTSTARVLAKTLNCQKKTGQNPCNKCSICKEISAGTNLDVLEIDGASNRGIDEIRNLRENVKLKSVSGNYRIYIIDEVHMLTPEAFNALLKTLEEPPAHVKFIFATTSPHKILPTIISRCQRFDFKTLPIDMMVQKLKEIINEEKIKAEDEALFIIAKNALGSLRDAQVMLDQVASFTKGTIKEKDVSGMLGILQKEALFSISEAILSSDSQKALELLEGLISNGKNPVLITNSLIEHFRDMLIISSCDDKSTYFTLTKEEKKALTALASKFSKDEIFYVIYTLTNTLELINKTTLGKIPLEVAIIKLARQEKMMPINELMDRIEELEKGLKTGHLNDFTKNNARTVRSAQTQKPAFDRTEVIKKKPISNNDLSKTIPEEIPEDTEGYSDSYSKAISDGTVTQEQKMLRLRGMWSEIIRSVRTKKITAGIYLEEGKIKEVNSKKIVVAIPKSSAFHKEALESEQNTKIIESVIKEYMNEEMRISFVFSDDILEGTPAKDNSPRESKQAPAQSVRKIEPIIVSAAEKFGGKIVGQYYVKDDKK